MVVLVSVLRVSRQSLSVGSWQCRGDCVGEYYLDIDVCKKHGDMVHSYFGEDMTRYRTHTRERYESKARIDNETFITELKEYEIDKDDYY